MNKKNLLVGLMLCLVLLVIHLLMINDYGLTWDFHHHFFAGLQLLKIPLDKSFTDYLPFTKPSPIITSELPFGPIMSIAPVLSYLIFFEKLKLLAFDNAYNLAIILSGVSGVFVLYLFLLEATNRKIAVISLAILVFLPRFFGDLHNNMKDIPQATAFTLAIWLFWRLLNYRRIKDLLFASFAFAIAFNTKVNTLAVPVIAFIWTAIVLYSKVKLKLARPIKSLSFKTIFPVPFYFILAPLLALLIWSFFWQNPLERLLYLPKFFQINTINLEVLYFGKWFCSGVNVPWHYPLGYLAITTPLPIIIFFVIGLIGQIGQIRQKPLSTLLLLWFFVPIVRYLYPKMGVVDGIRHFEEIVYPLAAIAGIGADTVFSFIKKIRPIRPISLISQIGLIGITMIMLGFPIISYHPYQIAYFNELVGGSRGAMGRFDIDYWGTSQKKAMEWINQQAPADSKISVVMAGDAAGKYLRPDLLKNLNTVKLNKADYTAVLNRQSFFYRYYVADYLLLNNPIYTVQNQGVPLVWIFDNKQQKSVKSPKWWSDESPCIYKYW